MNINIEISNINKHLFSSEINDIQSENVNKYNTRLINYCFYSKNEFNISNIIKTLRYYSNRFLVLEDYDFVDISELNEHFVDKCNLTGDVRYLIFKYKNANMVTFNDFLFNIVSPKLFILNVIESFSHLLTSLIQLNDNNICFFNLSPNNIGFDLDCGEKPVIRNFQTSLIVSKLDASYITNIIQKTKDYAHKPLEVHILFYLIKNDISTISYSFIQTVCEVFIKNASFLTFFSEEVVSSYKESCVKSLMKYINKPTNDIILDIIENSDKWDVYSLSVLYLHIFNSISHVFSLQKGFITKISATLFKNTHPDPSKRQSLKQLAEYYDGLFAVETNWGFVNKLSLNKMPELFDLLGK
jgi:hypothetical protein